MDFSSIGNSIKKGASSITEGVKKGASTFSESISLKSKIDTAEKTIAGLYQDIGKKFFEENKDNCSETFSTLVDAVKDNQKIIEEAKDALQALASQPKCPKCGAEVRKGSNFCTSCGAKLESEPVPEETPEEAACPVCKEKVEADAQFCPFCGTKIKEAQAAEPEVVKGEVE